MGMADMDEQILRLESAGHMNGLLKGYEACARVIGEEFGRANHSEDYDVDEEFCRGVNKCLKRIETEIIAKMHEDTDYAK